MLQYNKERKIMNTAQLQSIKQLRENWGWYLTLGISLVVLGTLAIFYSYASTIFSVIYFGAFLTILGIFEGIQAFKMSKWGTFFLHLLLSALFIIGGAFIVFFPTINAISLTLLLAAFLIASGILKIIFSFDRNVPYKGWLVLNGISSLLLGILIWLQWPLSGLWVIGMLTGIDAIFTGWAWIMLSISAKNLTIVENHHTTTE